MIGYDLKHASTIHQLQQAANYGTVTSKFGQWAPTHPATGSSGATTSSACPAVSVTADIAVLDSGEAVTALLPFTAGGCIAARIEAVDHVPGTRQSSGYCGA